jgi:hypothetical protein
MEVSTGYTVNTVVASVDSYNNPYSSATFTTEMFQNGLPYTGLTLSYALTDSTKALFNFSWSATTIGDYNFYALNNITGTIFISGIVNVVPAPGSVIVKTYVGL